MRALALEHLRADPVGIFGDVLEERGIGLHVVRLEQGEPLPDWRDYDLLVVMGGAMSVWEEDEYPWLVDEKRAIREAVLAGMPYFGVCLGSQLLASAFHTRAWSTPAFVSMWIESGRPSAVTTCSIGNRSGLLFR